VTPVKFIVGAGQILKGIDEGIVSFCEDSSILMEIPPVKAYGDRWEGPVPQWSYVYYNVTVTKHIVRENIEDGDTNLKCESTPLNCNTSYTVKAGDFVELSYKVYDKEKVPLGEGEMKYPVGRKVIVPGWDVAIQGSCFGQVKMCWIPSSMAHKMGTSVFLALPEKGFYSELKVTKILLTADNRDHVDLFGEVGKDSKNPIKTSKSPTISKSLDADSAPVHSEL
jgi:hypothetical protein